MQNVASEQGAGVDVCSEAEVDGGDRARRGVDGVESEMARPHVRRKEVGKRPAEG